MLKLLNMSLNVKTSLLIKTDVGYDRTVGSSLCGGFHPSKARPFINASGKKP
jgi:hypothetical protein